VVIRIESLTVENLRCFRGEHQLDLGRSDESSIDVVLGSNGLGKTTLADSIHLCLTGEFEDEAPLVTYELVDELSPGEEVSAKVSTVIADRELSRRFRFTREFQTSETRRGPVNSVDSLQVEEEQDGDWVSPSSSEAINTVFPLPAFTFSKLDAESSVGIDEPWGGTGWSELVEAVGEAAAQQSAARDTDLPEYFANDYDLGDEMISRINDLLPKLDERDLYEVEERQNGLVARRKEDDSPAEMAALSAGGQLIISHAAALVAGEVMPATPPLIGDTMFGRVDHATRERMFEVIKQADRQILLFSINAELEGFDLSPMFKLEQSGTGKESKIVAAE
jgi:predicted ATP-dependent endonuclease of OLD family